MPRHLTDDQLTDSIAGEVAERVLKSHADSTPQFQRLLVRLYTLQATGQIPPPGMISDAQLAPHLDMDSRRISETRSAALAKAYLRLRPLLSEH